MRRLTVAGEPMVSKTVRLPAELITSVETVTQDGETFSDVVRVAVEREVTKRKRAAAR